MFTAKDLHTLSYFDILSSSDKEHEIKSKNTGHFWNLHEENRNTYDLYHKHHQEDEYHYQTSYGSLFEAILDIVNHDEFQLRGRRPARYKCQQENSFFNELVKIYGNSSDGNTI